MKEFESVEWVSGGQRSVAQYVSCIYMNISQQRLQCQDTFHYTIKYCIVTNKNI